MSLKRRRVPRFLSLAHLKEGSKLKKRYGSYIFSELFVIIHFSTFTHDLPRALPSTWRVDVLLALISWTPFVQEKLLALRGERYQGVMLHWFLASSQWLISALTPLVSLHLFFFFFFKRVGLVHVWPIFFFAPQALASACSSFQAKSETREGLLPHVGGLRVEPKFELFSSLPRLFSSFSRRPAAWAVARFWSTLAWGFVRPFFSFFVIPFVYSKSQKKYWSGFSLWLFILNFLTVPSFSEAGRFWAQPYFLTCVWAPRIRVKHAYSFLGVLRLLAHKLLFHSTLVILYNVRASGELGVCSIGLISPEFGSYSADQPLFIFRSFFFFRQVLHQVVERDYATDFWVLLLKKFQRYSRKNGKKSANLRLWLLHWLWRLLFASYDWTAVSERAAHDPSFVLPRPRQYFDRWPHSNLLYPAREDQALFGPHIFIDRYSWTAWFLRAVAWFHFFAIFFWAFVRTLLIAFFMLFGWLFEWGIYIAHVLKLSMLHRYLSTWEDLKGLCIFWVRFHLDNFYGQSRCSGHVRTLSWLFLLSFVFFVCVFTPLVGGKRLLCHWAYLRVLQPHRWGLWGVKGEHWRTSMVLSRLARGWWLQLSEGLARFFYASWAYFFRDRFLRVKNLSYWTCKGIAGVALQRSRWLFQLVFALFVFALWFKKTSERIFRRCFRFFGLSKLLSSLKRLLRRVRRLCRNVVYTIWTWVRAPVFLLLFCSLIVFCEGWEFECILSFFAELSVQGGDLFRQGSFSFLHSLLLDVLSFLEQIASFFIHREMPPCSDV